MTQPSATTLNDNQATNPLAPGAGSLASSNNVAGASVDDTANIADATTPAATTQMAKANATVAANEEPAVVETPAEAKQPLEAEAEQPAPEAAPEESFRYTLPPLENMEQVAETSSDALRGQFNWDEFKQQLIENVKARNANPKNKDNPIYHVTQQRFFYHLLGDSSVRQLLQDRNIDATTIDKAREALARSEVAHSEKGENWAEMVVPVQLEAHEAGHNGKKKEEKKREVKVPSFFKEYVTYAQKKASKSNGVVTKHDLFEGALMSVRGFDRLMRTTGAHEILDDYGINAETIFPGPLKVLEDEKHSRMSKEVEKVMDSTIKPIFEEQSKRTQKVIEQAIKDGAAAMKDGIASGIKDAVPDFLREALQGGGRAPSHQERVETQKQQAAKVLVPG
jgi:hypothetical protein